MLLALTSRASGLLLSSSLVCSLLRAVFFDNLALRAVTMDRSQHGAQALESSHHLKGGHQSHRDGFVVATDASP